MTTITIGDAVSVEVERVAGTDSRPWFQISIRNDEGLTSHTISIFPDKDADPSGMKPLQYASEETVAIQLLRKNGVRV